ncbi:MAG TPA: CocE/NonD family hydrolase [Nocardioides sp.]|nr:CocE/NonD family hydrolase [Nocardioides sp.]
MLTIAPGMGMRRAITLVLAAAATIVAAMAPGVRAAAPTVDAWKPRPATYGVAVAKDLPITMSDGAVLAANVFRPANPGGQPAAGRFPVLVVQTPYNKEQQDPHNAYLVERGYIDVVVDVRGTGSSGGVFSSFNARSQQDSKEVVAWAAAQPWSTGAVGLHGESYYAINQLLTAAQNPPALKAMFPVVPTGDQYRSLFPGGYQTSLEAFALLDAVDGDTPPAYTATDPQRAANTLSTRGDNLSGFASYSADTMAGGDGDFDGPYYQNMSPLSVLDRIKTPTFLAGGWYDALSQRDAPMLYQALSAHRVPVKLLMGPWYHTTAGSGLPQDGVPSLDELQLRWFDHWVRGDADPGLGSWGPIVYDQLGDGHFHTAPTWPLPGVRYSRAYLGGTSTPGAAGSLSLQSPGTAGPDTLPWHPVSGACARSTYIGTFGLAPSTPCETDDSLNDRTGLVYDLPLSKPLALGGPMSAHLYVASSRADAFVALHLEDVDPATGKASELTSGWDSLSFRALDRSRSTIVGDDVVVPFHPDTKESVQQLQAGTVYDWWVEIRSVAATIPAGHMLRLSLQTADAVRFLPTAPRLAAAVGSVLSVYHDAAHPSALVLPLAGGPGVAGLAITAGPPAAAPTTLPATGGARSTLWGLAALAAVLLLRRLQIAGRRP